MFHRDQWNLKKQTLQNEANSPSLNTQSCIKGLLVVRDFGFWAVWAAGLELKKQIGGRL